MSIRKLRAGRVATVTASEYIGEYGSIFWDEGLGTLKISDGITPGGNRIVLNAEDINLAFGDFEADGNKLSTILPNEDLNLISNGTGSINIVGKLNIHTTSPGLSGQSVFSVDDAGKVMIRLNTISAGSQGLLISGSTFNSYQPPQTPGTMLHISGNDNVGGRIINDSFGIEGTINASPAIIYRYGRLTNNLPSSVQVGDILSRAASVGWGTTNYVVDTSTGFTRSANTLEYVALENFTDLAGGTEFKVYTTPIGSTIKTLSATFRDTGISTTHLVLNGGLLFNSAYSHATASGFNKSGGVVTANGRTGQLTSNADTIGKSESVSFTVNNSWVTSSKDIIIVNIASGAAVAGYNISVTQISNSGNFRISITNNSTGPLSEALVINFAVFKVE